MKHLDDYKKLHEQGAFSGMTLARFADPVVKALRYFGAQTVLDYGCGKAESWQREPMLADLKDKVTLFDPAVPEHAVLNIVGKWDAVLCFDVLEHVPEEEIDQTIEDLFDLAGKVVMISTCPRGSKKKLPSTGQDVHVSQHERDWWEKRIGAANRNGIPWLLFENP